MAKESLVVHVRKLLFKKYKKNHKITFKKYKKNHKVIYIYIIEENNRRIGHTSTWL